MIAELNFARTNPQRYAKERLETSLPEGAEYDIAIKINGKFDDMTSISNTVSNVAKRGNVYSLDGQILRQNATLNDVKSMGRGLYIINGVKVLVK